MSAMIGLRSIRSVLLCVLQHSILLPVTAKSLAPATAVAKLVPFATLAHLTSTPAAGIPLWVLPFEVLVTSNNTALIQLIADATSIHTIKARTSSALAGSAASSNSSRNLPPGAGAGTAAGGSAGSGAKGCVSLSDHFFAMWPRGSPECLAAQRRFVESLAGYSLIMHLLQVRTALIHL